ncbi:hypothetical protein A2303_03275 [Candidatus Falkowbacteria bacterium RIFOXYB2_FULL_47_14]|uniref:Uncharacterized protein n=1 Tax=Candidatus Falkowbacteria bacterium RIFOXYA2_FULL_47_19 TaxID=1797994 RepID=A0A1F5SKV5_9BACT|nr:MAG: hypothetical protein A2227_04370 [Candidatus Falkowbacteria bacterium RIFOXYA2_FULL_47_19]OGF36994.1 MAG: hypothetical protein A2468_01310 [Candidatus Falkowbacteria bacterium RIFOXYC2_FULL_46_15]OGF44030.1 MAG: hypothetical protein A2303_03275 [Candidatus Falkowbacteria bacterium RIFOXYB2_FULL_47_14]
MNYNELPKINPQEKDAFDEMRDRDNLIIDKFSTLNTGMTDFEDELNDMDDQEMRDGIASDLNKKLDSLLNKIIKDGENKTFHTLADKTLALATEMQTYIFKFDNMKEDEAKNAVQEIISEVDELLKIIGEV